LESLYIVMPAYNEEANIENVVRGWYPCLSGKSEDSRLVIADTGSKDKTHEILLGLKEEFPQLEVFTECEKQHGPKLIALYNYAISKKADFIFQTDSDGQTNPDEFKEFWDNRYAHSVILGNRVVRGDGASRKFVEVFLCMLLRIIFGVKVKDSNAPFRLMKVNTVKKYMPRFKADYNLPNVMLTTFFAYYKEDMEYKVITFKPRQGGKNSINLGKIIKIGYKALGDFFAFKKQM